MDVDLQARWLGLAELKAQLQALPDKLRRRVLRNALAAGARLVRDAAKARAPVLRQATRYRAPGTVRDAIKVRTSKDARRAGNVGVFVNVQPAKGGARGTYKPTDPYYWRWLEFGRQGRAGRAARQRQRVRVAGKYRLLRARRGSRAVGPLPAIGFLRAGAARLGDALQVIGRQLGPALQRILDRQQKD